LNTLVPV